MRRGIGPTLAAALAEARPGCCFVCDRLIPARTTSGRRPFTCGDAECKRHYQFVYGIDRRKTRPEEYRGYYARSRAAILARKRAKYALAKAAKKDSIYL